MKKLLVAIALMCIPMMLSAYETTAEVTAYTHTGHVMANGEYPHVGAIASDDLPIGTKVIINGREYEVKDRFGGGYYNRIDIFMETYEECIAFGRQYLTVEILL